MNEIREEFERNREYYAKILPDKCQNCGKQGHLHIHHIVPIALGGTNRITNLAVLCDSCHGKVHGDNYLKRRILQIKGIEKAKASGKHLGRPRVNIDTLTKAQRNTRYELYPKWKQGEITAAAFMDSIGLKKTSFYKIVKEYEIRGHL